MKYFLFSILLSLSFCLSAQDTFFRYYDDVDGEGRFPYNIVEYNERYFMLSAGICNNTQECGVLLELDGAGNIIWEKKMVWLDPGLNCLLMSGDTIVVAGNHNPAQEEFFLHYRSLDGDSIATHTVSDPQLPMTRMFSLGLSEFDNKFILTGTGRDTSRASLIYSVHKDGTLDTLLAIDRTDANTTAYAMAADQDGYLNILIQKNTSMIYDYRDYRKYDKDWNVVWSFVTEPISGSFLASKTMTDLENGAIVYTNRDFWNDEYIYKVDSSGKELWSYIFENGNSKVGASTKAFKTAKNGDIIGSGWWFDSTDEVYDFFLGEVPFIFRMSTDGELIWQTAIVEEDSILFERAVPGTIVDFIELDNDDILAVGTWGFPLHQKMALRIDKDGCIKNQCDDHFTVTSTHDLGLRSHVHISPNPTSGDIINIDGLLAGEHYQFILQDLYGNQLYNQHQNVYSESITLQTPRISNGLYLLTIRDDRGGILTLRVVKGGS